MVNIKKLKAVFAYGLVYTAAIWTSWATLNYSDVVQLPFLVRVLVADLSACLVVFLACVLFNSFSLNDLYWTLQASCLSIFFFKEKFHTHSIKDIPVKSLIALFLVNIWSVRLSYNLLSNSLSHVTHEDWRFSMYRTQWRPKIAYFLFGLFAFLLLPNFIVFVSCIPVFYVFNADSASHMILLDWLATLIIITGIKKLRVTDLRN